MQGWIKLHRQLAENPLWLIKPFSEGQAWVDLIMITTFDKGFIKTKNGTIIKLKKGECGYSQLTLSERWGWSRGKVKRYLKLLENEKMIQQKIVSNTTIINILKYSDYQSDTINDTVNGQQTIQQTDTIKNDKNELSNISYINSLSIEEREILKNYLLRQKRKPDNIDAYIKHLISNGDYKEILEKEKKRLQRLEEKKKQVVEIQHVELTEQEEEKILKIQQKIREKMRRG